MLCISAGQTDVLLSLLNVAVCDWNTGTFASRAQAIEKVGQLFAAMAYNSRAGNAPAMQMSLSSQNSAKNVLYI